MIDLSWSHILIVLIVALVVIGPKDLPRFMRMAGRWMGKARAMADQFRRSFDEMSRQAELDELRAELNALKHDRPLAGTTQPIIPEDMMSGPKPELHAAEPEPAAPAQPVPAGPALAEAGPAAPAEPETAARAEHGSTEPAPAEPASAPERPAP
ncbi:MAG: twin-arginine translocase subunit TatB [Alphaproteobacteria bacterium]|nr:twin-arginine translocase subunit TatB [Alphaproteobacteria bacterium]